LFVDFALKQVCLRAVRSERGIVVLGEIGGQRHNKRLAVVGQNGPQAYPIAIDGLPEQGGDSKTTLRGHEDGLKKSVSSTEGDFPDIHGLAVAHGEVIGSPRRHGKSSWRETSGRFRQRRSPGSLFNQIQD
jgi:hypothetical protein